MDSTLMSPNSFKHTEVVFLERGGTVGLIAGLLLGGGAWLETWVTVGGGRRRDWYRPSLFVPDPLSASWLPCGGQPSSAVLPWHRPTVD